MSPGVFLEFLCKYPSRYEFVTTLDVRFDMTSVFKVSEKATDMGTQSFRTLPNGCCLVFWDHFGHFDFRFSDRETVRVHASLCLKN